MDRYGDRIVSDHELRGNWKRWGIDQSGLINLN